MTNAYIPSGIRGVSEERRTPRLGKIRLGIQVPNKNGNGTHPEMSQYFVFDGDTAAGAALYQAFGDRCTEIPVAFPSDDPSEFARRNLEMWGAGTLKCRGNGIDALALANPTALAKYRAASKGERQPVPENVWASTARAGNQSRESDEPVRQVIPCFGLGYDGQPPCVKFASGKDCKATMHLQVIVRGFPGLGVFQVDTGSVVNIQRLDDFLAYLGNFTGGRFAMVPLLMRLEPYEMRGRRYYGLQFEVDFAAMQADGIGALPGVSQMSITDRVVRYLPTETARPADARMLSAGRVEDEAPADVDVETGEMFEADLDGAPDDAEPAPAPIGEEAMNAALAWLDEAAAEVGGDRAKVLDALEADIVMVAADLAGYQQRWAQLTAQEAAPKAQARKAPATPGLADVSDLGSLLTYFLRKHTLSKSELLKRTGMTTDEFAQIAEKEGGWAGAAAFIEETFVTAGASS